MLGVLIIAHGTTGPRPQTRTAACHRCEWPGDGLAGKDFTSDWAARRADDWAKHLSQFRDHELEIGSFEGQSALTFLTLLPFAKITCVDIFASMDYECRFDSNVSSFTNRIEKLKDRSSDVLPRLFCGSRMFDVIYVYGDHSRKGVLADSVLCWPLLKKGGVAIWDDYLWQKHLPVRDRPQNAIECLVMSSRYCKNATR